VTSSKEGFDREYQQKISSAVVEAIMSAPKSADGTAVLRNEDIVEALMTIQALMLSTSKNVASPTALRKWCEEYAKRLRVKTTACQKVPKPFDVLHLDEMQ
jgi:hypothetical protein